MTVPVSSMSTIVVSAYLKAKLSFVILPMKHTIPTLISVPELMIDFMGRGRFLILGGKNTSDNQLIIV